MIGVNYSVASVDACPVSRWYPADHGAAEIELESGVLPPLGR